MMVMTAKVNLKKILIGLAAAAGVILALIFLLGGNDTPTSAPQVSGNDARVQYLKELGWDVTTSPKESGQVKIPETPTEIYSRYNELQKKNGFDLTEHAGHTVMRYVYQVNNYPGAAEPVYATLLVHKDKIIGGDITDTSPGGKMTGLQRNTQDAQESAAT